MTGRVILNGRICPIRDFRRVALSLSDKAVLREKGGYLFKAALIDGDVHLGLVPWILDGERTYHYDIRLASEGPYVLIGTVDSKGVLSLLFVPEKGRKLTEEDKEALRRVYAELAALLTSSGMPEQTPLDEVTGQMLQHAGLYGEIPACLGSLKKL